MKQLPPFIQKSFNPSGKSIPSLWFEKGMALLISLNFLIVLFDYTYIPLRDFWLLGRVRLLHIKIGQVEYKFPEDPLTILQLPITQGYDWVKGVEPYRDTDIYLQRVKELENALIQKSLNSPEVANILEDLRHRSSEMVDTNPFQVANKTGTLERIKNLMRNHVDLGKESSKQAFNTFWSQEYLAKNNAIEELEFFKKQIKPLMETNYFRPIGENGEPLDNFGLLDFPFTTIFFLEFLARTWFISRQRQGVSWFDAMLWRWYDVFLFLPIPHWLISLRLFRAIPMLIRLHQGEIIDLYTIKKQASQGFVAGIAEDLTEVVVVGVINQVQGSVRRGELTNLLSQRNNYQYIDLNNINEVAEITRLVTQLVVNQVLPAAKEDVEKLLRYVVEKVINNSPLYQNLKNLPGLEGTKSKIIEQTISQLYDIFYGQVQKVIETDQQFNELLDRLVGTLGQSLQNEIQAKQSLERMEYLVVALLEEIKINYVQQLSESDVEALLDQTRALRQANSIS